MQPINTLGRIRSRISIVYFALLSPFISIVLVKYNGYFRQRFKRRQGAVFKSRLSCIRCFLLLDSQSFFFALGLSASFIGNVFSGNQDLIRQMGGIMVAVFGLVMLGIFTPKLMLKNDQFQWKQKPVGYLGSVLVGIIYAAGWTPFV